MTMTVVFQGRLIKSTSSGGFFSPNRKAAVRGMITAFSRKSRKRMIELVSRLDDKKCHNPHFITLTYPENMLDGQRAKRDLFTFIKRLKRIAPEISAIWRMEQQKRGAIHFHLIVWGLPYVDNLTIRTWWGEVIGYVGYPLNTDIRRLKSVKQMFYYVSKYMAKPSHLDALPYLTAPGRWWGVVNRVGLPFETVIAIVLSFVPPWYWQLKRAIRRMIPKYVTKSRDRPGFTLFTDHISQWYAYAELLMLS